MIKLFLNNIFLKKQFLLFFTILHLISTTSRAELKEHIKSIEEPKPPQSQPTLPIKGEQRRNDFDTHFNSEDSLNNLWWTLFGPIVGIAVMPVAPITYHILKFPNRSQENLPLQEAKELEFALGSGSTFSVTSLNFKYRNESSSIAVTFDADKERGFWTNFYSAYYVYTPNWKKQLKTGVGFGIKGFNYTDEIIQTQGSQTGFILNFPSEYYFQETFWSIFYSPQITYYSNNMTVLEMKLGVSYELTKLLRAFAEIDNKSVITKKDLAYGSLGLRYIF